MIVKNKLLILVFFLSAIQINVFAQKPGQTKEGAIFGRHLKDVRRNISIEVCNAFKYDNPVVLSLIKMDNPSFSDTLAKDTANKAAVKVKNVIASWPRINGDEERKAEKTITDYLNAVSKRCKEKDGDTTWVKKYRRCIKDIVDDYTLYHTCELDTDFTAYFDKYKKKGLFNDLAKEAQAALDKESENKSEGVEESPVLSATGDSIKNNNKDDNMDLVPIVLGILFLLGIVYFYRKRKICAEKDAGEKIVPNDTAKAEKPDQPTKPADTNNDPPKEEPQKTPQREGSPDEKKSDISIINKDEWVLVGASVKGNGHIQSNMPCQDNHKFESIGNGWGVAVVSDGAGSAAHSELGSKVVAERGVFHFKNLIEKEGWMKNNTLPTDIEWLQKSYYSLKSIRNEVELVARKNNVEIKSLSATCLVVIYSPIGLLAVHVGDGRMGYKSSSGEWRAMMTPHKGEEANQTIFLVSDFWSIPNYVMSGVLVPESMIVREPVKAFALMSDGCENTSWRCTTLNPETGKYYDQNKPFEGFFNPLEETLLSFYEEKVPEEERMAKWHRFIESGTSGFVKEQDDKTMVYGVNMNL